MKKNFLMVFIGLIFTTLHAQDYRISFVGSGESTTIDSIEVENINTSKILAFPGNQVLNLVGEGVGVINLVNNNNGDIKIFPNPITESSTIEFILPSSGKTNVEIFDIHGNEIASTSNTLVAGHHSFNINGLSRGIYVIKVYSNEFTYSGKLTSNCQTGLRPTITYNGFRNLSSFFNMKSAQTDAVMQYNVGDRLKITGKSGVYRTTITEILDQSKVITIPFIKCTDADGNNYSVVKIGNQVWMAENLKTTKYNDETPISNVTDPIEWAYLTSAAWCNYDNLESNGEIYGRLYNWFAVGTDKLAPKGWHVATDDEWTILENYLNSNGYNFDGTKEGNKIAKSLCAKTNWRLIVEQGAPDGTGTPGITPENNNRSGFTALPSGSRGKDGNYWDIESRCGWWSSTEHDDDYYAYYRIISSTGILLYRQNWVKRIGFSVRCICNDNYALNLPLVETNEVTEINSTTATSGGNISNDGGATVIERGVCWSENKAPTIIDYKTENGSGIGSFTSVISGLRANTTYYVRAYATNSNGTSYGSEIEFKTGDFAYGTMTDIEGNNYKTIKIGNQVWMAENLKTTKFNDGTTIPNVTDKGEWTRIKTGAYCNYDTLESNAEIYGRLYNWFAVNTGKLAPKGWHVPTADEWNILANYLTDNGYNYDGTKVSKRFAKSLCARTGWEFSNEDGAPGYKSENNNSTGFTALPGGVRVEYYGTFDEIGKIGNWWSSTESGEEYAYYRFLQYNGIGFGLWNGNKMEGVSVRLIKD